MLRQYGIHLNPERFPSLRGIIAATGNADDPYYDRDFIRLARMVVNVVDFKEPMPVDDRGYARLDESLSVELDLEEYGEVHHVVSTLPPITPETSNEDVSTEPGIGHH